MVATMISGSTAKVISARRQSILSMMTTIPASTKMSSKIATTPEVNISLSASTSVVTRVTRRPTGLRSKKPMCMRLQVAEDLAAQVKHDLLPGPLHEVGLQEFQEESENQQADVHGADLRDADQRLRTQEAVEKAVAAARRGGRQVFVDGDLGEVGADHVGGGLQHDGHQRNRHLPLVRTQVAQQPLHQPAVVGFSQDLFFVDIGRHLSLGYQTRLGRLRMEKVLAIRDRIESSAGLTQARLQLAADLGVQP